MRKTVLVLCLLLFFWSAGALRGQSAPTLSSLEDAPVVYNEGELAVPLTSTLEVASDAGITRAAVQITEGYQADQDQLLFDDTEAIRGVFDEPSGTLLLLSYPVGAAQSAINFQNALRRVTYRNTEDTNPSAEARSVSFQVFDEQDQGSNLSVRNVQVVVRNDAPEVVIADDTPLRYPLNAQRDVLPFDGLSLTDPDGNVIEGGRVTINDGFRDFEDRLSLVDDPTDNIIVSGSGGQTINLIGADTPEAYRVLLRDVRFSNGAAGVNSTSDNRLLTVTVNDGDAQSIPASRYVVVGEADAPPFVQPLSKTVTVGTELTFTVAEFAAQYNDSEGTPLAGIYVRSKPQYGALLLQGDEIDNSDINADPSGVGLFVAASDIPALVYRPPGNYLGSDRFWWSATDGTTFAPNDAAVNIEVAPPAPSVVVEAPTSATTAEDTEVLLPPVVLTTSRDETVTTTVSVSNGTLTVAPAIVPWLSFASGDGVADASLVFSGPAGAVAYALSGLRYIPDENYNGTDGLSVNVSTESGVRDQAALAIVVVPSDDPFRLANLETKPISYTENDPPVSLTDQIVIEDLDSESDLRIASATVTITEGYVPGEDSLRFTALLNIEGEQQDNALILRGVNDIGAYQTALRTITYQNTSEAPAPAKTVTFSLQDESDSTSNAVSRDIVIQSVEDPPQLVGLEDFPLNYVVENDFADVSNTIVVRDPDTETLNRVVISFTEGYDPALDSLYLEGESDLTSTWDDGPGILTLAGAGQLDTYTQALRSVRYRSNRTIRDEQTRTLSIQAFNGEVASNVVSRSILLIANDPPTVADFEVSTVTGVPYVFTLADFADHYDDPDNSPSGEQPAQIRITALPADGRLVYQQDTLPPSSPLSPGGYVVLPADVEVGRLRYVPSPDFTGLDAIGWNAYDGAEVAESAATVEVSVREGLAIDILADSLTVCAGVSDTLAVTVTSGSAEVTYAWSCEGGCNFVGATDQPSVVVAPTLPTTYIVSVGRPADAQTAQDSVTVVPEDCSGVTLNIPTAFTPNADQDNDTWVIPNAGAFSRLSVEVFDRYGHTVYRNEDYQNDWEGTYEGEPLPVGTYYYLVTNAGGQTYKGALSILR